MFSTKVLSEVFNIVLMKFNFLLLSFYFKKDKGNFGWCWEPCAQKACDRFQGPLQLHGYDLKQCTQPWSQPLPCCPLSQKFREPG
jgi:hypothetical protein